MLNHTINKLRIWIEGNLAIVLIAGYVIGLFAPAVDRAPPWALLLVVAGLIYFACAKATMDEIKSIRAHNALGFYVARYLVFPFFVYWTVLLVLPQYKEAALLMAFAPAAASSGTWSGILGGSTVLALGYTAISSLFAPFVVPSAFVVVGANEIDIDKIGMLATLAAVIFLPMLIYFVLSRPFPFIVKAARSNMNVASVILLGFMALFSVAKQRDFILSDPMSVISAIPLMAVIMLSFFVFGWFFPAQTRRERISHLITSGLNNVGLSIGISTVFMPSNVTIALLAGQLLWVISLVIAQKVLIK